MKSFWNPFTTYALASVFVTLVYSVGFSALYPPLSLPVISFLLFTTGTAIFFSLAILKAPLSTNTAEFGRHSERMLAVLFVAGFAAEFAHFGGIPLFLLLSGQDVDYREFGIPTFHVVLIGTCFFYSVYWWDCYLCTKDRRYLPICFIGILGTFLMVSRGGVLILLLSFLFVFGNRRGFRTKAKTLAALFVAVVLGFGYLGEVRVGSAARGLILSIGAANDRFINSGLPDEVFWFYLYVSSPLANFEYTAQNRLSEQIQLIGIAADFLPDFLSKYFVTPDEFENIASMRITYELTVGTAYARPLITLGWIGPYALHAFFLAFFYTAIVLSRRSKYYGALLGVFSAQGCLMFFDNMLVFAGGIVPALVGITLAFFDVVKQRVRIR